MDPAILTVGFLFVCLVFVVIYCGILRVIYRETDRQRWLLIPKHNFDKS